jgi:hypothetical protein
MLEEDLASRLLWVDAHACVKGISKIARRQKQTVLSSHREANIRALTEAATQTTRATSKPSIRAPSSVMMADVAGFCLNSSATYLSTAVKGAASGTDTTLYGSLGSLVSVIFNETFGPLAAALYRQARKMAQVG